MLAREIMDTRFHTLRPDQSIVDAVKTFHAASIEEQKKIFGMMVIDEQERLVGRLSMYDILRTCSGCLCTPATRHGSPAFCRFRMRRRCAQGLAGPACPAASCCRGEAFQRVGCKNP